MQPQHQLYRHHRRRAYEPGPGWRPDPSEDQMRIACLIAAGLLLAAPALAAERPHNAKYSRAADPRPRFSAPVGYAARAVHTRRLARPVARRLVGGYGYGGI